jgi:hypothetical protein
MLNNLTAKVWITGEKEGLYERFWYVVGEPRYAARIFVEEST